MPAVHICKYKTPVRIRPAYTKVPIVKFKGFEYAGYKDTGSNKYKPQRAGARCGETLPCQRLCFQISIHRKAGFALSAED